MGYQQPAPLDHTLHLRIGLKLQNIEAFHQRVFDISTPGHPSYGLHLNREEIAIIKPNDDSATLVLEWLESFGIVGVHDLQWVTAKVTVAQAQALLQTTYNLYLNPASHNMIVRTPSYSLPSILTGHVDLVQPTTVFGMASRVSSIETRDWVRVSKNGQQFLQIAPSPCIRTFCNTANYVPVATDKNRIGVVGFHGDFASKAGQQTFLKRFRPDAYVSALTFPTPATFYSIEGRPPFKPDTATPTNSNEPFIELLDVFLKGQAAVPQTLVIGYAANEQTVPKDYAEKVCSGFAQLGAKGVTVIVAPGDDGVGAGDCRTNGPLNQIPFQPMFPASCPFVTTVGATRGVAPEVAASFSGGRPFQQGSQSAGLFNRAGRAYPVVAALANGYQVVIGGRIESVSESAAGAYAFGSVVSLLNDARRAAGKPQLEFVNPLLYRDLASGMNDITSGSNPGCSTTGFSAGLGWDPVTGLGTPDFHKLKKLVLQ
ncbi:hypothetical protein BGZ74_004389 [Mortierella antarctica]|nr:hypothetical protein BGZ74_004389 [Mortierella antarctica]